MQTSDQKKGIRLTVVVLCALMALFIGLFLNKLFSPKLSSAVQLEVLGAKEFDKPRRFKQYTMLDEHGVEFDYSRLQGQWSLVFFGFTFCPDICPATLAQLKQMQATLDPALQESTQIILVSVDPARDTPDVLKTYLDYFSPEFVGLTGEYLSVRGFAEQLNAAFQKVVQEGGQYTVDHSGQIMLINPRGDFHGFIKPPFMPEKLAKAYTAIRNNYLIRYDD